jgi:hypothetical protein
VKPETEGNGPLVHFLGGVFSYGKGIAEAVRRSPQFMQQGDLT